MELVTVYRYYTYILGQEVSARARRRATLEAIERVRGVPMHETARVVQASQVDHDGFLKDLSDSGRFGARTH
jgi:hypothetical protein